MKQHLLNSLILLFALIAGGNLTANAADETITFSELGLTNQQKYESFSGSTYGLNFDLAFGSGSNDGKYYNTGAAIRVYGGGHMTVSSTTKSITKIELTFGSGDGSNAITANEGTYNAGTWTGNASSVTFTVGGSSGHRRIASVAVTYSTAAPTTCATPSISGDAKFLESTEVSISCGTDGAAIQYSTDDGANWNDYSAPFTITETTTVKAKATKAELDPSDVASMTFTKVTPMTVAEAIAYIDLGENLTGQYVSGIVSQVDSYSSNQITYWISDNGTTTDQMEVYRGKGLNNANFTAETDLEVGDKVVVYGTLQYYSAQSVYEFASGNYLKSLIEIQESDLTKTGNINLSMANPSVTAAATDYFTTSSTGAITYESNNTSVATVSTAGVVTPVAQGSATITVSQVRDENYKAGEITINVIVAAASLNETEILAETSGSTTYGTNKEEDYFISDTYDGTVAAVSSNTAVATVAITQHVSGKGTFTITPVAVGTAVITISAPSTATCEAADDVTYTITVNAPVGGTEAAVTSVTVFTETFDDCGGTGGNDDQWSGTIASSTLNADNDEWTFSNGSGADQCAKFGTGSKKGSATTPALGAAGTLNLSFKAAAWNGGSEGTTLNLSVSAGNIDKSSVTLTKGAFNTFTATITNATAATTITFEANNTSNNRFFLDDVVVTSGTDITATLNASGYATYCSEYPLDFTDAETDGYSAWQITNVSSEGVITFAKVTGTVKGGTGLLLKGDASATVTLTSSNSNTTLDGNKLVGTLAPSYFAAGDIYGLSADTFKKNSAGTMKANKAYLPASEIPSSIKSFTLVFEDQETGITTTETMSADEVREIFDLQGRRLARPIKGINIINGKKVLVK